MTQINDIRPVDFSTGSKVVIRVENLWKQYRLGSINHGTLARDMQSWWARIRGRDDPNQLIPQANYSVRPLISEENSSEKKSPDHFWALQDISFDVEQGEILGVIGKNGAGKSTLLKILSQVTMPSKGQIKIKGRTASLLEVGTGFHPELTGLENIFLNGAILGMNKQEINRKLDEIIAFAEVDRFVDTPVKRYSSGMYVRLAFAVAAHLDPEILVVDEVLAVGDSAFQKKCVGKMNEVAQGGRTVLIVSHNLSTIRSMTSSCIVIDGGRLVSSGQPNDAIDYYLNMGEAPSAVIAERTDRSGNGKAKVVDIKVFDAQDRESCKLKMGSGFSVEITIEGEIRNAIVGVLFGNNFNRQIFRAYSYESCTDIIDIKGKKKVTISFNKMSIVQGNYQISTWVGEMGDLADEVDNAVSIEVVEEDVFKTGRILNPKHNIFYAEHEWHQQDVF